MWRPLRRVGFEVGVGGYFAIAADRFGPSRGLVAVLACAVPLLVILLVDAWSRVIYTNLIGLGLLLGLGFAALDGPGALLNAVVAGAGAAAVVGGLVVLAAVLYRTPAAVPFGVGDVSLAAVIGTMTGYPSVVSALFLGVLAAAATLLALLRMGRIGRRNAVPYGPFLCAGALVVLLFPT